MLKKASVILLLFLFFFPSFSLAATYHFGYMGTTTSTPILYADSGDFNDYWTSVEVGGSGSGSVVWYGPGNTQIGTSSVPGTVSAPGGAIGYKLVSTGGEIHSIIAYSTNPTYGTVIFDTGNGGSSPVINMPFWDEYTGKLEQILAKIPSPPNWNDVAGIFRDTIAPRIKSDLESVIGVTPSPPGAPTHNPEPDMDSSLDYGGLTPPTGQNAPGLDGFTGGDIKNAAPTITERTDPTGGFVINDPVSGLPSQEDFIKNIPGNPSVPGITEPTFTEPTITEPEPTFTEPTVNEPTITEPEPTFTEPTITEPTGDFNTAPTPTQNGGGADPITGDFDTPPIPGQDWNPPIP